MNLYDYQERSVNLLRSDPQFQRRMNELRYLLTQPTWKDADVFKRCATLISCLHVQVRDGGDDAAQR